MKIKQVVNTARTVKALRENPFGFLLDLLVTTIIRAIIPIPFVEVIITRYRTQILFALGSIVFLIIAFIYCIFLLVFKPNTFTSTVSLTTFLNGFTQFTSLQGYRESGIADTDIPIRNPLGGNGFANALVTMEYHDSHYTFFDGIHTGIDLIPSDTYYKTNLAYIKTGELVVFATMNGKATYFVDQFGANVVDVVNANNTMLTRYVHLKTPLVQTGHMITAGQPIGIMGATGEATGVHLHYEVRVNQGGTFITVNPGLFIQ